MTLSKKKYIACPYCNGTKKCGNCKGTGIYIKSSFFSTRESSCNACNGLGFCPHCGGVGKYDPDKVEELRGRTVKVKCPKCDKIIPVLQQIRPLEFLCPNCGMKLLLRK